MPLLPPYLPHPYLLALCAYVPAGELLDPGAGRLFVQYEDDGSLRVIRTPEVGAGPAGLRLLPACSCRVLLQACCRACTVLRASKFLKQLCVSVPVSLSWLSFSCPLAMPQATAALVAALERRGARESNLYASLLRHKESMDRTQPVPPLALPPPPEALPADQREALLSEQRAALATMACSVTAPGPPPPAAVAPAPPPVEDPHAAKPDSIKRSHKRGGAAAAKAAAEAAAKAAAEAAAEAEAERARIAEEAAKAQEEGVKAAAAAAEEELVPYTEGEPLEMTKLKHVRGQGQGTRLDLLLHCSEGCGGCWQAAGRAGQPRGLLTSWLAC